MMESIRQGVLSLLVFASVAGFMEMLLPESRMRGAAEALLALLSAKMLLEIAIGLFGG